MIITDEMVKVAMDAFGDRGGDSWFGYKPAMRAALEAAMVVRWPAVAAALLRVSDQLAAKDAEIARLREALDRAYDAMNDWCATAASVFFSGERVIAARKRISAAGGTLAYFTEIADGIRKARAGLEVRDDRQSD